MTGGVSNGKGTRKLCRSVTPALMLNPFQGSDWCVRAGLPQVAPAVIIVTPLSGLSSGGATFYCPGRQSRDKKDLKLPVLAEILPFCKKK